MRFMAALSEASAALSPPHSARVHSRSTAGRGAERARAGEGGVRQGRAAEKQCQKSCSKASCCFMFEQHDGCCKRVDHRQLTERRQPRRLLPTRQRAAQRSQRADRARAHRQRPSRPERRPSSRVAGQQAQRRSRAQRQHAVLQQVHAAGGCQAGQAVHVAPDRRAGHHRQCRIQQAPHRHQQQRGGVQLKHDEPNGKLPAALAPGGQEVRGLRATGQGGQGGVGGQQVVAAPTTGWRRVAAAGREGLALVAQHPPMPKEVRGAVHRGLLPPARLHTCSARDAGT